MLVVILGTTISQTDDGNEEAEQKIFQPLRLWIQRMNCGHELDDCTNSSQSHDESLFLRRIYCRTMIRRCYSSRVSALKIVKEKADKI